MATIRLYYLHSGFSNVRNEWSMFQHHCNEYRGDDDEGVVFDLPEGFTVADDNYGMLAIWDAQGHHCDLGNGRSEAPRLYCRDGKAIEIERTKEAA